MSIQDMDWQSFLSLLPPDLDKLAKETGALTRRREIKDASTLLRLLMTYCLTPFSFRQTAAWAREVGLAQTSDVNLIERFEKCPLFLEELLAWLLQQEVFPEKDTGNKTLRLVDATMLSSPGGGTNWRLHLSWSRGCFDQIRISHEAESLTHFTAKPGDLVIGDRAYGNRKGIAHLSSQEGVEVLCRIKYDGLPVTDLEGNRLDLVVLARKDRMIERPVLLVGEQTIRGRVIISPKPPETLEKSHKRMKRRAAQQQRKLKQKTLEANQYLFLFTTCDSLSGEEAVSLYRFRWQIELLFKRLKSIQGLDQMNVKEERLCRVFILCHCLVAIIIHRLAQGLCRFFPLQVVGEAILMAAVSVPLPEHRNHADSLKFQKTPAGKNPFTWLVSSA